MNPKVSVIMPVYNTGKVLIETIESVLGQTNPNFELILIDDGSTDGSGEKCDEFACRDSRIKVIHKSNGGICSARNCGLNCAKGEYITFCDHDDLYLPDLLQEEITAAQEFDADIVIVGKRIQKEDGARDIAASFVYNNEEIKNHMLYILGSDLLGCVWNVLYKKSILQDMRFNENYKLGHEDYIFNLAVLQKAKAICSLQSVQYIHIIRNNLSTSARVYREAVPAMVDTCNKVFEMIQQYQINIDDNVGEVIKVHGGELRNCLAYAVKTGMTYSEFKVVAEKLQYFLIYGVWRVSLRDWKEMLLYKLLCHGRLRMLYIILQLNRKK